MTKSAIMYVAIGQLPSAKAELIIEQHKVLWDRYRNNSGLGKVPILFIPVRNQDTKLEIFEI